MFYEVLPAKVFRKSPKLSDGILTYSSEEKLQPGTIVEIPLGKSTTFGVIYQKADENSIDFKVKPITSILYPEPLPTHLVKAMLWLSEYYLVPLPQVVSLFLPNTLSKKHKIKTPDACSKIKDLEIPLNSAQKTALQELKEIKNSTKLLHGVTGSGKTNIYLKLAIEAFKNGQSTILLVPEISLTSQLVQVFSQTFTDNVILIHSKQTDKTRRDTWEKILADDQPKIIIGPRSAMFAPLKNLGLIIIDEAHESTYFQDQAPKYSALRLASFIAKTAKISCLLGTATPLVSDYCLAKKSDSLVEIKEKAKPEIVKTSVKIVDFKDREIFGKNRYFSTPLLEQIEENLKNGYQTLIYHNRRGSAPLTICEHCGWQALCPNCLLPLTLHTDLYKLVCHTCGFRDKVPVSCPSCKHPDILHKGFGTKMLESELRRLFKNAKIARFDADNDKDSSLDKLYDDVKTGNFDIIIGTQTVARGLDLPHLATVGVVQADSGLSLPDYSSEERTFHLLTQVLGRIGRGHIKKATAIIQTYQPDSLAIKCAITGDYEAFYNYLIEKRKKTHFPPFFYIAKVSVVFKTEKTTLSKIKKVYQDLRAKEGIFLSAPTPAFHEHTTSGYTWQIIIKSTNRQAILDAISSLDSYAELRFVIDPPSLLN
jgi:primosomal protein N' (replication factor Y)